MLTNEQLDKIEQDAKQATPGSWEVDPSKVNALGSVGTATDDICQALALSGDYDHYQRRSNARHIANCDPQTIMELVKMARRYAWLREKDVAIYGDCIAVIGSGDRLDADIDQAIKEQRG